jgi:hypothetical protein
MKPAEHVSESHDPREATSGDEPSTRSSDPPQSPTGDTGWRLWPPSPKMQIALIAVGFGLFNLVLIAIWAVVMVYRF